MDTLESASRKVGFVDYVFKFDNATKDNLMNMGQYALMAMLPVVVLNKSIQRLFPEADDEKLSYVIAVEIIAQILVLLFGMFFIHRIITYFTPYSRHDYEPVNFLSVVIMFLIVILSFQTRVGEKMNILYERAIELWTGEDVEEPMTNGRKKTGKGKVRVTQPISGAVPSNVQRSLEGFNGGMNSLLPAASNMTGNPMSGMSTNPQNPQRQQMDMAMGAGMPMFAPEPMPANAMGGFSSF